MSLALMNDREQFEELKNEMHQMHLGLSGIQEGLVSLGERMDRLEARLGETKMQLLEFEGLAISRFDGIGQLISAIDKGHTADFSYIEHKVDQQGELLKSCLERLDRHDQQFERIGGAVVELFFRSNKNVQGGDGDGRM